MLKKLKRLLNLLLHSSILFLVLGCSKYEGELTVIETYLPQKEGYVACSINDLSEKLGIENIWKYKNGKLVQYQGCASEGLYTEDFEKENTYSLEEKKMQRLSIEKNENNVIFFDKKYKIIRINKDSIFTKSNENIFVFVGNIN